MFAGRGLPELYIKEVTKELIIWADKKRGLLKKYDFIVKDLKLMSTVKRFKIHLRNVM